MSYVPPSGNAVNFTLPIVAAGGTVLKRPVAMYGGRLKELQAGDSLFGFLKVWVVQGTFDSAIQLVNGDRLMVNSSSGPQIVRLPPTPVFNDTVSVKDYARTFGTYNCTVERNGELIDGVAADLVLNTNGAKREFVYSGNIQGWVTIND